MPRECRVLSTTGIGKLAELTNSNDHCLLKNTYCSHKKGSVGIHENLEQ